MKEMLEEFINFSNKTKEQKQKEQEIKKEIEKQKELIMKTK